MLLKKPLLLVSLLGFFVDVNVFKVNKEKSVELAKDSNLLLKNVNATHGSSSSTDGLADEDANLMVKLKFLTYKVWASLVLPIKETYWVKIYLLFCWLRSVI